MRLYSTCFITSVTLLASSAAHAAGRGDDIWLKIIRLIAPGI